MPIARDDKGRWKAVPFAVRFRARFRKKGPRECWPWTAARDPHGYGIIAEDGDRGWSMRAQRASWIVHRGPIPQGLHVLHKCDHPWCVNPRHLFLGTNVDNQADKYRKGRQPKHEKHGRAKLTMKQAREIRRICAKGVNGHNPKMANAAELARRYGVSRSLINWVRKGTIWT